MKRIGMLTSGGDCQGLNAAIRGVAKALYEKFGSNVEIYGIFDGYKGLMQGNYKLMEPSDFSNILALGGTILGTSRQPFKLMRVPDEKLGDKVEAMKATYHQMKLDGLVILGGNGTHKTANLLAQEGLCIITLPKTIDNDLWGTDMTFGFYSALELATQVIDCIHTTATSHGRVFIVEIMGHKVGWLPLYAGMSGGADVILIPEIPYNLDNVVKTLTRRDREGKRFSILAVAEGAISTKEAELSKKELKSLRASSTDPAISYRIARELGKRTDREIRVAVPGHFQRGGGPCAYDRAFATRLGAAAARLIADGDFGYMVALRDEQIVPVRLSEVAGKLKTVPMDCNMIRTARDIGVCFGDA